MKILLCDALHASTVSAPPPPLSSTWPHLNSDVGLEEGEY